MSIEARFDRLPLTYGESRARFRRAAGVAGVDCESRYLSVLGRDGLALSIDVARLGADVPHRGLIVLSGVHGVEGYIGSALQTDLLYRINQEQMPEDFGMLLVHAVNPWGMDHWRRQNESNVDLNRNWRRSEISPPVNAGYEELHEHLCPEGDAGPDVAGLVEVMQDYLAKHGLMWILEAISNGQYSHPDGLHYGGEETEESTVILDEIVSGWLAKAKIAFTMDLHTGHGNYGTFTLLSDMPPGSAQDSWLRANYGDAHVEATRDNPGATTSLKYGQIANGFRAIAGDAEYYSTSLEFGTADPVEQLTAAYLESYYTRKNLRDTPEGAAAVWRYRCCFTPDDPDWEDTALTQGRELIDTAIGAVAGK